MAIAALSTFAIVAGSTGKPAGGFALEAADTPGHVPLIEDPGPSGRDADLVVGQPCDVGSPPLRFSAPGWLRSWVCFFP